MAERFDVAVVGAGLAGLSAAKGLSEAGRSRSCVLEAMDRVGGRTLNHTFSDGTVIEIGGQWVGPTQDRLYALAAELGIEHYPTWDEGENLLHRDGRLVRYSGETFGLPPHVLADLGLAQWRIDRLAESIPLEAPWQAAKAERLDSETVASWVAAQRAHLARAGLPAGRGRGGLLGRARGHLDAPLPLLPALGRQPRPAHPDRRRRPGVALRRRLTGGLDPARRAARRDRAGRLPGALDRAGPGERPRCRRGSGARSRPRAWSSPSPRR